MQLNDAVWKLFEAEQAERDVTMARCDQRNPFTDECWHHGNDEFVDRVFVEERSDDLASAHQPHVLAWLSADAFGKRSNRLADEVNAGRH